MNQDTRYVIRWIDTNTGRDHSLLMLNRTGALMTRACLAKQPERYQRVTMDTITAVQFNGIRFHPADR